MTRLELYIIRLKPIQAIFRWLNSIYLPRFEGVSLFDSLNFFRKQIFSNRFYTRASSISFSFIMALPPLLLFFFTLIPYLPLPEDKIIKMIMDMMKLLTPSQQMQQGISKIIKDFINHKKNVLLSFSVLLTIYYSSNGMMALMNSFDRQLPGFKRRQWYTQRGMAILLTFLLIIALLSTLLFMLFQSWLATGLGIVFLKKSIAVNIIAYFVIVCMCLITTSFIYKFGTATHTRLKLISPGSIIATFLITVFTTAFFYAINNLINYDKIYGSIGTIIIFLVWINFMAQILLIGFELNASIIVNRKMKVK